MSLEWNCESVFIDLFNSRSALSAVQKCRHGADDEIKLPAIVVKASIINQVVPHPYRESMRMTEVELTIELTALIGQTPDVSIEGYWQEVQSAIDGIRFVSISSLSNFRHFTILDERRTERSVSDDRSVQSVTLNLLVQSTG